MNINKFITLEGCEGVGKTTQIIALREYLAKTGQKAVFTREPGGTPISEEIRNIILSNQMNPYTEAHLFAAARIEHINDVILPALKKGEIVVCDRYIDSSLAYQGYARGLGLETVLKINHYAVKNCMPTATVFFDLAPENNFRARKGKIVENDKMEAESLDFHYKVYQGFKELNNRYPERFISIFPTENKAEITELLINKLKERGLIE